MGTGQAAPVRPPLIVAFDPAGSFSPMQQAEAFREFSSVVWLVREDQSLVDPVSRFLARLGTVVDNTGLSPKQTAEVLGAHEPRGIVTFSDTRICEAASIAEHLGLPFASPVAAARLTNKLLQRQALEAAGLPVPGYCALAAGATDAEIEKLATGFRYPAVVKPQQSNGSRHTYPLLDPSSLPELYARHRADLGPIDLIVEEYIPDRVRAGPQPFADYVSVETVVSGGHLCHLAVTGRLPLAEPFRETGFFIPAAVPPETLDELRTVASEAVRALGVETGCLHTEIKLTPYGPRVLEVNGRAGGGVPEMLLLGTGVSLLGLAGRIALGEQIQLDGPLEWSGVAYLLYVQAPAWARRVVSLDGLQQAGQLPGVDSLFLNRPAGSRVDPRDGNHGYVYSVLGTASDHDEMVRAADKVVATVPVEFE